MMERRRQLATKPPCLATAERRCKSARIETVPGAPACGPARSAGLPLRANAGGLKTSRAGTLRS